MGGRGCVVGRGCWVGVGGTSKQMTTMAEVAGGVGALTVGCIGGGKLYILGVAGYNKPIWDVLALQGEREC